MPLTPLQCDSAKPRDKNYSLSDGGGLGLSVRKSGVKKWEFRYRFEGNLDRIVLGDYPAIPLKSARAIRAKFKAMLDAGENPRGLDSAAFRPKTFGHAAEFWFNKERSRWSPGFAGRVWSRVERDLLPNLGDRPLGQIDRKDVLEALRAIEDRGALETARRTGGYARDIFDVAINEEWCESNPAQNLTKSLKPKQKVKHNPRVTEDELPGLFAKLAEYDGNEDTRIALKLVIHTFVRTKELIGKREGGVKVDAVRADELDFDGMLWRIPTERMKRGVPHIVPLTETTAGLFRELIDRAEPGTPLLNMSNNTMIFALYRMGYHTKATVHGLRSTASTILNECGLWRGDVIERQLSHVEGDEVRAAYNSALYLDERRRMMTWYSDLLDRKEAEGLGIKKPDVESDPGLDSLLDDLLG